MILTATLIVGFALIITAASVVTMNIATKRYNRPINIRGKKASDTSVDTVFKKDIEEGRKWISEKEYEEQWITAHDSVKLYGRFYRNNNSKTTILMMHGFRSNAMHDFSCAFKFYFDKGFNLLVPDQRAHGKSEGKYITYGIKERHDAKMWLEHINTLIPDGTVYATGVSMGASTVLMAAGLGLPENVKGIIADCGFTSPAEIIKKVMKSDMRVPLFPIYYTTRLVTRAIAGFDFEEYSAVTAVKDCKIPILFLHGKNDGFVPFSMGEEIYNAAGCEKKAVWVDGADHGCSFLVDHEACSTALTGFLGI